MSFIEQDERTEAALSEWVKPGSTFVIPSFFFWETGTDMQRSV